jgi:uncharacterized membrane protein
MKSAKQIAPLQLLVIGFKEPNFQGQIIGELQRLRDQEMLRIVDSLAVSKSKSGEITAVQISDLPKDERVEYGAIISGLVGFGAGGRKTAKEAALGAAMLVDSEYEYGMSPDEIETISEDIPEGGAAVLLLLEHLWALPLKNAVREAGGTFISQDFLSPETLIAAGKELLQTHTGR